MKRFTLILIGAFFASMFVYSQQKKLSLNLNNVTVKEALEAIKKTGGYTYWFDANDLDITQKVSINVINKNIALRVYLPPHVLLDLNPGDAGGKIICQSILRFHQPLKGCGREAGRKGVRLCAPKEKPRQKDHRHPYI